MMFLLALCLSATAPLPIVALDAGHGGDQDGAVGACGLKEKDLTLALSRRVADMLRASGQAVPLLVRTDDITLTLEQRAQRANLGDAALYLSIHANASLNPAARGIETFFLSQHAADGRLAHLTLRENDGILPQAPTGSDADLQRLLRGLSLDAAHAESQQFALQVQQVLAKRLHARGRGVLQAPFMVLLGAHMAAVLVEVGFLTHPAECQRLGSEAHQDKIAQALSTAILAHLAAQNSAAAGRLTTEPRAEK